MRQKFQKGLGEFKSRGKGVYKLPWYVIIGESGSGKTEALRHSGIEFPPGLQDELQGTGGTVNMDWWFTNRAVILDTAGKMVLPEAKSSESPEWKEFLRLLKRNRPHCPINGLFLVLSIESLIKDSAETIAAKASRLAQQLDLIQRTLDVRFPVYLLVTKCDLLTGFREFFDSIDDPLLQHQMFGWSNPSPLDDHFRPDLVDQHLRTVAEKLRRRRLALLRDVSSTGRLGGDTQQFFASTYQLGRGPAPARRLDEVDAMFALPESLMRLAPRLRRYLETIFVAGEWSAKPVFLRGIYFTTSMREGKALDEAMALATGLPLDQLPEDKSWEKNRAFFLRDLFHEKVFRESGLVTRATNTLQLLRTRQLAIFGTAGFALLLLVSFACYGKFKLQRSVETEASYWRAGTNGWDLDKGEWTLGSLLHPGANDPQLSYGATNLMQLDGKELSFSGRKLTALEYHENLEERVTNRLSGGFIFKPISWLAGNADKDRLRGQRILFEAGVLKPLFDQARSKMEKVDWTPTTQREIDTHRSALVALMRIEAEGIRNGSRGAPIERADAESFLKALTTYVINNDSYRADTNIVDAFTWTYSKNGSWPPKALRSGDTLANNPAIASGLDKFHAASMAAKTNVDAELKLVNDVTDSLRSYYERESALLANQNSPCDSLDALLGARAAVETSWARLEAATNPVAGPLTSIAARYTALEMAMTQASASGLSAHLDQMFPENAKSAGLFVDIQKRLKSFVANDTQTVRSGRDARADWIARLDTECVARGTNDVPVYRTRCNMFANACALRNANVTVNDQDIGTGWKRFHDLQHTIQQFRTDSATYKDPLPRAGEVGRACDRIATVAADQIELNFAANYANYVTSKLKFPARLVPDSGRGLGLRDIVGLNQTLKDFQTGLDDPVWNRFSGPANPVVPLRTNMSAYIAVVSALLAPKADGIADMELVFIPPKRGDPNWTLIRNNLRDARLVIGDTQTPLDLTRYEEGPASLGHGPMDAKLTLSFLKNLDDKKGTAVLDAPNWMLPRMILDGTAHRVEKDDGTKWRLDVKAPGSATVLKVFEIHLAAPLPAREDWPR